MELISKSGGRNFLKVLTTFQVWYVHLFFGARDNQSYQVRTEVKLSFGIHVYLLLTHCIFGHIKHHALKISPYLENIPLVAMVVD